MIPAIYGTAFLVFICGGCAYGSLMEGENWRAAAWLMNAIIVTLPLAVGACVSHRNRRAFPYYPPPTV